MTSFRNRATAANRNSSRSPTPAGGRGSPSSAKANNGRASYKPLTQTISPERSNSRSFDDPSAAAASTTAEGKQVDLRDSLNRKNESRRLYGKYEAASTTPGTSNSSSFRLKDPRPNRDNTRDLREHLRANNASNDVTAASSGDETTQSFKAKKPAADTATKSTKLRRNSSDSVRSSSSSTVKSAVAAAAADPAAGGAAGLMMSPSYKPQGAQRSGSTTSLHQQEDGRVAGADDISDGSRPGTPLFDERPEEDKPEDGPVRMTSLQKPMEPMSLPLPKFAAHVMATSPPTAAPATAATASSAPAGSGKSALAPLTAAIVGDQPQLISKSRQKSPPPPASTSSTAATTPTNLASVPSLKSPSQSNNKTTTPKTDNATSQQPTGLPHDPRLLLQAAPQPKSPSQEDSPAKGKKKKGVSSDIEVSDISDSDKDDDGQREDESLEARLKAFTKNYEKWSGTTKFPASAVAPAQPALPAAVGAAGRSSTVSTPGNTTPASVPGVTPVTAPVADAAVASTASATTTPSQAPLPSSAQTLPSSFTSPTVPNNSSSSSSATGPGGGLNKFSLDLKPTQPSPIVQRLLSRKSVFDEDSKRLETSKTSGVPQDVPASNDESVTAPMLSHLSVGSVNFNTISTLSDRMAAPSPIAAAAPGPSTTQTIKSEIKTDQDCVTTEDKAQILTPLPQNAHIKSEPTFHQPSASATMTTPPPPPVQQLATGATPKQLPMHKTEKSIPGGSGSSNSTAVNPTLKTAPLPSVIGTSTTTTPIKPLVDVSKARAVAVTKPSATVTPTFKNSTSTTSAASVVRRPGLSTTTTVTKTVPTTAAGQPVPQGVEKGEASSTTSSPKTLEQQLFNKVDAVKDVSPVSSTHPDPFPLKEDSRMDYEDMDTVSSTTRELDLKNLNRDPLRALIKKDPDHPGFGPKSAKSAITAAVVSESSVKAMDKVLVLDKSESLFAPAVLTPKTPTNNSLKFKENKTTTPASATITKPPPSDKKLLERSHSTSATVTSKSDRKSSASGSSSQQYRDRKMKEIKARELPKDFLTADHQIPRKPEFKKQSSVPVEKSRLNDSKHKANATSGNSSQDSFNKRRLSSAVDSDQPKAKQMKIESGGSGGHHDEPEVKKVKMDTLPPCPTTPVTPGDVKTLGRIPKIKKVVPAAAPGDHDEGRKDREDKKDVHKSKHSHHDHGHKSKHHKDHKKDRDHRKDGHRESSSHRGGRDHSKSSKDKTKSSSSSHKSSKHSKDVDSHRKKRHHSDHSDDEKRHKSKKRSKSKEEKNRRKSTSSSGSNGHHKHRSSEGHREKHASSSDKHAERKKTREISSNDDMSGKEKDSGSDSEPKKQFSIFDEPIFDLDNPVYFSMYDKVKARRYDYSKESLVEF